MSFLSKVELKYQLQQMGIQVEGNYVRKKDIEKIISASFKYKYLSLEQLTMANWLKATKTTIDDWDRTWSDYGEELGITDNDDDDDDDSETNRLEVVSDYIRNRFMDKLSDYRSFKYPLTVYRRIAAPNVKKINFKHLGIFWSLDADAAQCYWKKGGTGAKEFLLEAEVPKDAIDWVGTITQNIHPSTGDEEQEITLLPNKKIKIMPFDFDDEKTTIGIT